MITKHTPGPWMNPPMSNEVMTVPTGAVKICRVYPVSPTDNGEANAKLIAAAPDLLEALQALVGAMAINEVSIGLTLPEIELKRRAKIAIQKATNG